MSLLVTGKTVPFIVLIGLFIAIYYSMMQAQKAKELPYIRKVAGLDAIEESVERSSEMNRPVIAGYGLGGFDTGTLSALSITGYVARVAARTRTEIFVPAGGDTGTSIVYPQAAEIVRNAYDDEGRLEDYKAANVIFLSESQFAWATAQIGMIHEKNVGAAVFTGLYGPEVAALSEEAKDVGAVVIVSGDVRSLAVTACIADYILIGEELYAAGAYLSKDPVQIGSIRGQDWGKIFAVALIIIGVVALQFGFNILTAMFNI
jgi:hypothetical protein